MQNDPVKDASSKKAAVNFEERIAQHQAIVDKLRADHEKAPTAETAAELKRKADTLLHLKNMAKGDPRQRARTAAETARKETIDRAVKQIAAE